MQKKKKKVLSQNANNCPSRSQPLQSVPERSRLKPDGLAVFANSQLNRTSNDPAFGGPLGFALPHEESTVGTEAMATLMAVEALVMPLPPNGRDNHILLHRLLATHAFGGCTARIALKAPSETILFNKWGLRIEWL